MAAAGLPRAREQRIAATPPGVYRYRIRGAVSIEGQRRRPLGRGMEIRVSAPRRSGDLTCIRVQHYFPGMASATTTVGLLGGRAFLLGADTRLAAAGLRPLRIDLHQSRPLLIGDLDSVSASLAYTGTATGETEYATFSAPVVGRYAYEVVGLRRLRIGSRRLTALGIEQRAALESEDVTATQRGISWLSTARQLILAEDVEQSITAGSRTVRTTYRSVLRSTRPGVCCSP